MQARAEARVGEPDLTQDMACPSPRVGAPPSPGRRRWPAVSGFVSPVLTPDAFPGPAQLCWGPAGRSHAALRTELTADSLNRWSDRPRTPRGAAPAPLSL